MTATGKKIILIAVVGAVVLGAAVSFLVWNESRKSRKPEEIGSAVLPAKEMGLALSNGVSMKFALIPAGTFKMGSPASEKGRDGDEGPVHTVKISKAFYMGIYEVTQQQYESVMGKNPSRFKGAKSPVESVSWNDATAFCRKMSTRTGKAIRLPTEAEWEYACRAGSTTAYYFGNDASQLGRYAWYDKNALDKGEEYAHAVGRKLPNAWGLYDMHGNVWEWCEDWYAKDYSSTMQTDPKGPAAARFRVLRGGSWSINPWYCRSAVRARVAPDSLWVIGGFRVVVSSSVGLD